MVDKQEIMRIAGEYFTNTGDVSIDDEGVITCTGSVWLTRRTTEFPVSFKRVDGPFYCTGAGLRSLRGSPSEARLFQCHDNELESLEGGPISVTQNFWCQHNKLTNLVGAPQSVGGEFRCYGNPLTSLDGLPKHIGAEVFVTYTKDLPLLRCLAAQGGVYFYTGDNEPQKGESRLVGAILNRYKGRGKRALFDAQKHLEDAGFSENARW